MHDDDDDDEIDDDENVDMMEDNPYNWLFIRDLWFHISFAIKYFDRPLVFVSYPNFWPKIPPTRAFQSRPISAIFSENSAERYFKIPHNWFRVGPSSLNFHFLFIYLISISIFYLKPFLLQNSFFIYLFSSHFCVYLFLVFLFYF